MSPQDFIIIATPNQRYNMKTIKAIVKGRLIVKRSDLAERIRNVLISRLTWDNPDYKDAGIRRQPTVDKQGNVLIPKHICGYTYNKKTNSYYIAREFYT